MEHSPANIRIMHHIGEFLDLDLASFDSVAGFLALLQAMRDGLTRIDEYFAIPDFHISVLFLSKLEAHPDWKVWARSMMQDKRMNTSDPAKRLDFNALSKLAIERETLMRQRVTMTRPRARTVEELRSSALQKLLQDPEAQYSRSEGRNRVPMTKTRPRARTVEEVKSSTSQRPALKDPEAQYSRSENRNQVPMTTTKPRIRAVEEAKSSTSQRPALKDPEAQHCRSESHNRVPSRESLKGADTKGQKEKELSDQKRNCSQRVTLRKVVPRIYQLKECFFCGESDNPGHKCQRRMKAIVEAPRAGFAPKQIQYRTEPVIRPPIYHSLAAGMIRV